ncbi:MAG: carbohydrate ABC transporter permease, partial [Trebonia sp.]
MTSVPVRAVAAAASRTAPPRRSRRSRRLRRGARKTLLNLAGLLVALFALFPVLWMISTAFKPPSEIFSLTPHPVPLHPTLDNFRHVFSGSVIGMSYWHFLGNSLFITIIAVAVSSLVGLLAAIALGRFKFRFRTTYLIMLLIVQVLPQQALVVSLFIDFRKLNLLDSLTGLIAVYIAFALPVTIWML